MTSQMSLADLPMACQDGEPAQRVAILEEPGRMVLGRAGIPEPGPDEVRVKVKWVGICGSDVEAFRGCRRPEFLSTPSRLGHEVAGTIDKVGGSVAGLREGDRVTCRYVWGAFAEYIVCRPFNIKVVPDWIPLRDVSLLEILPGVMHTAELAKLDQTKTVLVMGQGVSGLVLTQVLRYFSPRALAVTDLHEANLRLARRYGASHTFRVPDAETPTMEVVRSEFPSGFDVVVPCLLEGDGMVDAIDCAALAGRIVMYGCIGVCNRPVDFFKVHRKRLEILSTEPKRDIDMRRYFQEGLNLALDGLLNTSEMITHEVPLSEVGTAFSLRDDKTSGAIHVLVDCEA